MSFPLWKYLDSQLSTKHFNSSEKYIISNLLSRPSFDVWNIVVLATIKEKYILM